MKAFTKSMHKKIRVLCFLIYASVVCMPAFSQNKDRSPAQNYNQRFLKDDFVLACNTVFSTAQNLELSGLEKEAVLEYKRFLFLTDYNPRISQENTPQKLHALSVLSRYYQKDQNYELALKYNLRAQEEINFLAAQDFSSLLTTLQLQEIELESKICFQNQKELGENARIFYYAHSPLCPEELRTKAQVCIIKNLIEQTDWDLGPKDDSSFKKIEQLYQSFCQEFPDYFCLAEQTFFYESLLDAQNFHPKNPDTAMYLSILPGLGQLYTKNPKDSLNAFVLNGTLITASVFSICNLQFQDFLFLEASPVIRFYSGNLVNSYNQAIDYNEKEMNKKKKTLLELLENVGNF